MPTRPSISEQLVRQSVVPMESTVPPDMTLAQWRRLPASRPANEAAVLAPPLGRSAPPATSCGHLHDSTTRYDHDQKVLTFLLVCPVCGTERVMETQHYEPTFEPRPGSQLADASVGATIHALPVRRRERPIRRAA
jgi:hypothetical protein